MASMQYVNGELVEMTSREFADLEAISNQPDPVPEEVTMRQARLALLGAGILDDAEAAIAGLTGAEGRAAQIEWEYAAVLRRDHPLVAALGQGLGLDDEAKDALFRTAGTL